MFCETTELSNAARLDVSRKTRRASMIITSCLLAVTLIPGAKSFTLTHISHHQSRYSFQRHSPPPRQQLSVASSPPPATSPTDDNSHDGDGDLLETVTKSKLQDLCTQFNISTKGTKEDLLSRLRQMAQEQASLDLERRQRQIERIKQGVDDTQGNGKAKHKVVAVDDDDADGDNEPMEGSFYFSIPGDDKKTTGSNNASSGENTQNVKVSSASLGINPQNTPLNTITAPQPPPGVEPNADGEKVVTVYSSTDQNDLTGIAAQSSSTNANEVAMMGGYSRTDSIGGNKKPENTLAGGPFGDQSGSQRKKASDKEYDEACEILTDLVLSLLQMTGAPGFQDEFTEGVVPLDNGSSESSSSSHEESPSGTMTNAAFGFIGFDPSRVPTAMITQSSSMLRVWNGDALKKVLTDFEMQAIGYDGMAGDDKKKGGGHYLEVQKVGTFLEGFRKAEVRRIARETATMLLDKLVSEGVKSLDQMLVSMTKGSDDSSVAGELNDSLVNYLEDAVRQQEKKVEQMFGTEGVTACKVDTMTGKEDDDMIKNGLSDAFWEISTNEKGEVVESLDPNDPVVKKALERELELATNKAGSRAKDMPTNPAQQLLMLLTLLRERVKAEAAFSNDEKGRNLRMLAYCLHAPNQKEREAIIMDNLGTSLDRMDSFSELLQSSIDYAESTSHQLQPSKSAPLNVDLLKSIKDMVEDVRERQVWKASGISSQQDEPFQ